MIDVSNTGVDTGRMTARPKTKRTYNLPQETLAQVRELAGEYGSATSQDAVAELAVESRDIRARYRSPVGMPARPWMR